MKSFKQNTFILILSAITLPILIVFMLYVSYGQINVAKNNFNRQFVNYKIDIIGAIKKSKSITGCAGIYRNNIYFSADSPNTIYKYDISLKKEQIITLALPKDKLIPTLFNLVIQDSSFAIFAGNSKSVHKVPMNSIDSCFNSYIPQHLLFTRAVPLKNDSYVIRGFEKSHPLDQIFIKVNTHSRKIVKEKDISELNNDAGISTDGLLHYDSTTNLMTYISFFSNKIICMDTNIILKYESNTIDTLRHSQTFAGRISSDRATEITNLTPSTIVNWDNCVNNGLLFNLSNLKADNENALNYKDNAVIDIYDILSGSYKKSLYIPNYNNEKMRKIYVGSNKIVAIYPSNIIVYGLPKI